MNLSRLSLVIATVITAVASIGAWLNLSKLWLILTVFWLLGIIFEWHYQFRKKLHSIELESNDRLILGNQSSIILKINNLSHTTCQLQFRIVLGEAFNHSDRTCNTVIAGNSSQHYPIPVTPLKLGTYSNFTIFCRRLGPSGLIWWPMHHIIHRKVTIYPDNATPVKHITASNSRSANKVSGEKQGSGYDIIRIREYQPGDPLKNIAWKTTAKFRKPFVREFSEQQYLEILQVLDIGRSAKTHAGELQRLEHYINTVSRVSRWAYHNQDATGLMIYANKPLQFIPVQKNTSNLIRQTQLLESLSPLDFESNALLAAQMIQKKMKHRGLIILYTGIENLDSSNELLHAVQLLQKRHVVIVVNIVDTKIRELESMLPNHWLDPFYALAAKEYQTQIDKTICLLEKKNIYCIHKHPKLIADAVLSKYQILRTQNRVS